MENTNNQQNQKTNTEQSDLSNNPETPNLPPHDDSTKKDNKKKIIIISAVILLLLGGGVSAWLVNKGKTNTRVETPQTIDNQNTNEQKLPEEAASKLPTTPGILAYHLANPASANGTVKAGGDIWTTGPQGTDKKQLTKNANLNRIYGWSTDNKYILANVFVGAEFKPQFAIVNASDGTIKHLNNLKTTNTDAGFVWLSATEFGYVSDGTFYKTNINDETSVVVNKVANIPNFDAAEFVINPTGKKIAFYEAGERAAADLYVVDVGDINNPKKVSDKLPAGGVFLSWVAENLYFTESKSLVKYTSSGQKETVFTIDGDRFGGLAVGPDEKSVIYTVYYPNSKPNTRSGYAYEIEKLYGFDVKAKQSKEIITLPPGDHITKLQFSRDASLAAYSLSYSEESYYKAPMRVVTVNGWQQKDICTSQCQAPSWQQ